VTITEATHALAALQKQGRSTRSTPAAPKQERSMRLVDAMSRVEPTWVEAVAIVHAICATLEPGRAMPSLDDIMISPAGAVSFPPTDRAPETAAIKAAGRLIALILRSGDCPMPVWESMELARRDPGAAGTARAFGLSLTCFPAAQGPAELAKYFQAARRVVAPASRAATAPFALSGLTLRAGILVLMVALAGIGAGISVGTLVAVRTGPSREAPPPARMAAALPPN
jgi:hypothetical protein